ncbi:zinc finger SWIM domain-containing protein 3, partial [Clonorchis sinensis]
MTAVRATSGVDLAESFNETVGIGPFPTLGVFQAKLSHFQRQTGTSYVIRNSISRERQMAKRRLEIPAYHDFYWVQYVCIPNKQSSCPEPKQADFGCPALICLVYDFGSGGMRVSKVNMRHPHTTFEHFPSVYYANRRLSADQESEIFTLMETCHSNVEIRDYVRQHWNLVLTDYDLRNMRSRRREVTQPSNELESIKQLTDNRGYLSVVRCSETRRLKFLGFSLNELKELFSKYNEVLLFDSTTQCNRGSYHLWHVVVIDCHGKGRSVYYGFIENETVESYERVLRYFCKTMPEVNRLKTVICDRHAAQLAAIRKHLPWVRVHLCSFQVVRNFTDRLNNLSAGSLEDKEILLECLKGLVYSRSEESFNICLQRIRHKNTELYHYLQHNWLPHTSQWAAFARKRDVSFGQGTNNMIEAANHYIKSNLSQSSSLVDCVRAILKGNGRLRTKYSMQVARGLLT